MGTRWDDFGGAYYGLCQGDLFSRSGARADLDYDEGVRFYGVEDDGVEGLRVSGSDLQRGDMLADQLTWCEIDAAALSDNIRALKRHLPSTCLLAPAVKSNGYGHGLEGVNGTTSCKASWPK